MERYQATLAYDGTSYEGFEAQPGRKTIQGEVEQALKNFSWSDRKLLAGGRTDSGVHAQGQVIAFDLDWKHSEKELCAAINAKLPPDIRFSSVSRSRPDFHPRYDAVSRTYRYRLYLSEQPDPFRERYALRVGMELERDRLQRISDPLVGEHDFRMFGMPPRKGSHSRRTIFRAEWVQPGRDQLEFWVEANAFLYRMVRMIVGTILYLERHDGTEEEIRSFLTEPIDLTKKKAGPAAPAKGLCLMEIRYPDHN